MIVVEGRKERLCEQPGDTHTLLKGQRRCYFNIPLRELKASIHWKKKEGIYKKFWAGAESGVQVCKSTFVLEDVRAHLHTARSEAVHHYFSFIHFPDSTLVFFLCLHICFPQTLWNWIPIENNSCAPLARLGFASELSFQLLIGYPPNDLLWIR